MVMASVLGVAPAAYAGTIDKHGNVRDSGCYGRVLESKPIVGDFRTLGRVELWYSSRNGGENCVITRSYVGRAEMVADLALDMDGNKRFSPPDVYSSDHGIYNSYAGGAYRSHADGRCVRYQGLIWKSGDSGSVLSGFVHCG
jgi:hypothetical protein